MAAGALSFNLSPAVLGLCPVKLETMVGYPGTRAGQPPAPPLSDGLIFSSQISNIKYQVSNILQLLELLHVVTVSGHDMEGLGRLTYCHRKCFHGERLPTTNKAVTIAGRAGTGLALSTFLSSDCCSAPHNGR